MEYDKEFLEIIKPIIDNKEFIKRKKFHHHENESVYDHSMAVAYFAYKFAKKHHLDYKSAAIGGLLHDFYYKDWQLNKEHKSFFKIIGNYIMCINIFLKCMGLFMQGRLWKIQEKLFQTL